VFKLYLVKASNPLRDTVCQKDDSAKPFAK